MLNLEKKQRYFFFFLYISYFFGQRALVRTKMTPFWDLSRGLTWSELNYLQGYATHNYCYAPIQQPTQQVNESRTSTTGLAVVSLKASASACFGNYHPACLLVNRQALLVCLLSTKHREYGGGTDLASSLVRIESLSTALLPPPSIHTLSPLTPGARRGRGEKRRSSRHLAGVQEYAMPHRSAPICY